MTRARVLRLAAVVGLVALAACAGILGLRKPGRETFPHRAHVVAGVSCTRCHVGLEAAGSGLHLPTDATCTSCHTRPHDPRPCSGCHTSPTAVAELLEAQAHLEFDHARHTKATSNNCMKCHDGVADGTARMRPPMATCFRCHDDTRQARKCDACHRDLPEEGTLPASHLAHDGDWIREHGTRAASSGDLCQSCHKETFCASCHGKTVPTLPAATRFADPTRAGIHRAGFASRHALEARSDPGACATCHTPDRCAACHTAKGSPAKVAPRRIHRAGSGSTTATVVKPGATPPRARAVTAAPASSCAPGATRSVGSAEIRTRPAGRAASR